MQYSKFKHGKWGDEVCVLPRKAKSPHTGWFHGVVGFELSGNIMKLKEWPERRACEVGRHA